VAALFVIFASAVTVFVLSKRNEQRFIRDVRTIEEKKRRLRDAEIGREYVLAVEQDQENRREMERALTRASPPEIDALERLVHTMIEATTGKCRWDNLIAIGDVYQRGAFPRFLPDPDRAMQCYKVAAMSPAGRHAGLAQSKYIQTRMLPIPTEDQAGQRLPSHFADLACDTAYAAFVLTPRTMFEAPRTPADEEEEEQRPGFGRNERTAMLIPHPPLHLVTTAAGEAAGNDDELALRHATFLQQQQQALMLDGAIRHANATAGPAFKTDSQNVHDHAISSTTDHNLKRLIRENEGGVDGDNTRMIKDIRTRILALQDLTPESKEAALHVLSGLGDATHSTYGSSERQALAAVWNNIQTAPEHRENLEETLAKQLASAVENGHTVCSTGKIARIVSTLDGVSHEAKAAPMWAVREEIGSMAAKVRDEVDDDDAAREAFAKRVSEEYVQKLGMNATVIGPLIEEYSAGF
jgi:hypothetical protein